MTTLIFSNADYYKNEQFIKLMRNWNYYLKQNEVKGDGDLQAEVKRILIGDFYKAAKEWLFSLDGTNIDNYSSLAWKVGLE
jgi:hypothetical protein